MTKEWLEARWHQDSDGWLWRVYTGNAKESVSGHHEDTTDIYIIPRKGNSEWWIVDAKAVLQSKKESWVAEVQNGAGQPVAGPFPTANDAKAMWRVIYG